MAARCALVICCLASLFCNWSAVAHAQTGNEPLRLEWVAPEQVGMDGAQLAWIDRAVQESLESQNMPGCVVAVGRHGKLALCKAYGHRQQQPTEVPMDIDTVFDLASLTKPIATATSIMLLIERGQLRLRDRASDHIPEFGQKDKNRITIEQLLTHQSGLIADNALSDYADGLEQAWQRIFAMGLEGEPGSQFLYSDMNYIMLGELVRRITGQSVHEFSQANIFQPLGMRETGFLPDEPLRQRAAPTEQRDGHWMQGEVHDPRAYALGGVAGHAGLFSTAHDLAIYAQMMLNRGRFHDRRILGPATVDLMTRSYAVSSGLRGLGWDKLSGFSSNRGENMSEAAYGHGGFTGTGIWIDPNLDLFVIFLSSRLHPDGKGSVNPLIGRIGSIAVAAINDAPRIKQSVVDRTRATMKDTTGETLTGLDVLRRDDFVALRGRKIGLITNQTGVARDGTPIVRLLREAPGVTLVALFSPEHGIEGKLDVANIEDAKDPSTGLTIHSLYGATRKPTAEMLQEIDTLVFDIQDIGTRFYTYVSTMGLALEAVHEHKRDTGVSVRFVVLDRPNPIGGNIVQGPVLDSGRESFVGFHPIAVRHGMTVGELARMICAERQWDIDLQVVGMESWQRSWMYDQTGLPWINPSPNMRNLNAALFYPGIGLLETTNISVGRGTDSPFEILGAPWIDGIPLAQRLYDAGLPGIRAVAISFTPSESVFAGKNCQGVRLLIHDRDAVEPLRVGFEVARSLHQLYPEQWEIEKYDRLLANHSVLGAVRRGASVPEVEKEYAEGLADFVKRREKFLLY